MKKFEDIYLFSDIDGTLINGKYELPRRSEDALKYFIENGGHFALATGRGMHPNTVRIAQMLPINFPCIMLNGAMICDLNSGELLHSSVLPREPSYKLVKRLIAKFPHHSIVVWRGNTYAQLGENVEGMMQYEKRDFNSISDPLYKIVISNEVGKQHEIVQFIEENISGGIYTTTSSPKFVEIMPEGINKGYGVEWLIKTFSLNRKNVVVMGDYYNDYEMLSLSGVRSFCPQNAEEEIKTVCERAFCAVDDGTVADVIAFLEKELN